MSTYEVLADKSQDEKAWREARTKRLTATDVAALMGANKYSTPLEVFVEKISQMPRSIEDNEPMAWGRALEPVILDEYRRRQPPTVGVAPDSRLLGSVPYPWLAASPDAWRREESGESLLEVKTTRNAAWDVVPQHYQIQVHVQMIVTGTQLATILALFQGSELREYEVAYRPDLGQAILDVTGDAWERIKHGVLPEPQGAGDMKLLQKLFPPRKGNRVMLPPESRELLATYQGASAARKSAEQAEEAAKAALLGLMRDAESGVIPGTGVEVKRSVVNMPERVVKASTHERLTFGKQKAA